ncbi:MAG: hypothetical protein QOC87_2130 [Actinomycetota bacterium]|jgi:hypothetical protein|nr:hypothetical protein [Actinomycetota bacterium]
MTDQSGTTDPGSTEQIVAAPAAPGSGPTVQLAIAAGVVAVAAGVLILIVGWGSVPLTRWKTLITLGRYILGALLVLAGGGCFLPAVRNYALGFILGAGLSLGVVAWFNGYPIRSVIPGIVLVAGAALAGAARFVDRTPRPAFSPFAAIGVGVVVVLVVGLVLVEVRFIVRHEVRDSLKPFSQKPAASILLALSLVLAVLAVMVADLRTAGSVYLGVAAAHLWSLTPIVALLKLAHFHPELGFWFLLAVPIVLALTGGVMVVMGATRAEMTAGPGVVATPVPPAP